MASKPKMTAEEHDALGQKLQTIRRELMAVMQQANLHRWTSKQYKPMLRTFDSLDDFRSVMDSQYFKDVPDATAKTSPYYGHSDFERKES